MVIPDFYDLVVTRLQAALLSEVAGLKRTFKERPSMPLMDADLPAMFPVSAAMVRDADRKLRVTRAYVYRLCVLPLGGGGMDNDDDGAFALNSVWAYIQKVQAYLVSHPRLSSSMLAELECMAEDVLFRDSGATAVRGPGGVEYGGCDFTLTISMMYGGAGRLS